MTFTRLTQEAKRGEPSAQFELGVMLQEGVDGIPKDMSAALNWYFLSAKQGHAEAAHHHGFLLENGANGVPKNASAALKWYHISAELGYAKAAHKIAVLLEYGAVGVPRNASTAVKWYTRAVERGGPGVASGAAYELGLLLERGADGVPKNVSAAMKRLTVAAKRGNALAKLRLASLSKDTRLRKEAIQDFDLENGFSEPHELEHGDAVVGYTKLLGVMEMTHWAIYDEHNHVFIELTGDHDGDKFSIKKIIARPFQEWVDKWKRIGRRIGKVTWKDPYMVEQRAEAVKRAWHYVGSVPKFVFFPAHAKTRRDRMLNFASGFNGESFVRWCYTEVAVSMEAIRLKMTMWSVFVHYSNLDITHHQHLMDCFSYLFGRGPREFTTTPFHSPQELEHGDAVLVDILGGAGEHWAIYDKEHNEFVELTRGEDRKARIVARSSEVWMGIRKDQRPQKVIWGGQWMTARRSDAVASARKKIGTSPHYTLLARLGDSSSMNCESFIQWCYTGRASSLQAQRIKSQAMVIFGLLISLCVYCEWTITLWGLLSIIVILVFVQNFLLVPVFQSRSI